MACPILCAGLFRCFYDGDSPGPDASPENPEEPAATPKPTARKRTPRKLGAEALFP